MSWTWTDLATVDRLAVWAALLVGYYIVASLCRRLVRSSRRAAIAAAILVVITVVPAASRQTPVLASGASSEGDSGSPTSSILASVESGSATWYCRTRALCTRGYGPSDAIAAIDRKDSVFRKGDRVVVRHGDRSVVVTIVDVCACKGSRIIDLSRSAFARLAPLGLGVIPVTLSSADAIPLPPTDTRPRPRWKGLIR